MERLKNVYKITAKTEKSEGMEKYIFSHTPDNAAKKMRVYLERKGEINAKIMNVEQVLKDVIYQINKSIDNAYVPVLWFT